MASAVANIETSTTTRKILPNKVPNASFTISEPGTEEARVALSDGIARVKPRSITIPMTAVAESALIIAFGAALTAPLVSSAEVRGRFPGAIDKCCKQEGQRERHKVV